MKFLKILQVFSPTKWAEAPAAREGKINLREAEVKLF